MKQITINPVTRLEGHARIDIFLDEDGHVANTYFQVPELRGFEQFCVGRRAEEMPVITNRICGVCPEAHHMASVKALDALFAVEPPRRPKKFVNCCIWPFLSPIIPPTSMPSVARILLWGPMPRPASATFWGSFGKWGWRSANR